MGQMRADGVAADFEILNDVVRTLIPLTFFSSCHSSGFPQLVFERERSSSSLRLIAFHQYSSQVANVAYHREAINFMPTAGNSTSITRARGSANDPPYSPPKVIRKYGTKYNNRNRRSNTTAASVDEKSQLLPGTDQGNHSPNISALEKEAIDISDSDDDDEIAPVVSLDENIKQDLRKTLEELAVCL
ncbi:hypothetical protein F5880DRAFT_1619013 [Lentinula raphanica]|nr:hypothetical protein F5880DRAFT_1619013 [Lentinula raphanica]